jgi:FKBP-type peptidyl-prolyl cis-trans isomerase
MGEKAKRVTIIIIVVFFLVSTFGFTGVVIWQMTQDNKNNEDTTQTEQGDTLQGTKLAGFEPVENVKGTGKEAGKNANITAHYTGALASTGIIFESSLDSGQPATFGLEQVIKGWQEGVPGMKEGGKRRLLIPASLAYADRPPAGIPANADLVFDIELIKVN